ncbi:MAG: LysR family transcriptional regulator [Coriobacteriales bacterium]|jgi:DNA-binding transcriptional LysR family regulator
MQIESLRYFTVLVDAGSFYGAAKKLQISQQGLNKAITSLENELGCKLLNRSRRGVSVTRDGEIFLKHSKKLLEEYKEMIDEILESDSEKGDDEPRIPVYVTYYPMQIAAGILGFLDLAKQVKYIEEPFDKVVQRAAASDGSEVCFVDVYPGSAEVIEKFPDLVFEPLLNTLYGAVWSDGSPLEGERVIHRERLRHVPIAVNTFREMVLLRERVFADSPLENIVLGVTSPRMLLEFAQSSSSNVATFDSFGFYLSCLDPDMPTDGLHYTPLATPLAHCQIGFLYNRRSRPNIRCRHIMDDFHHLLASRCGDYLEKYPL